MRRPVTWYLVGYVVLVGAVALAFHLIRHEAQVRADFDNRRQYDICLAGNDRIADINERFDRLDQVLISFGEPNDPRVPEFLAEEKKAALKPRQCELEVRGRRGQP